MFRLLLPFRLAPDGHDTAWHGMTCVLHLAIATTQHTTPKTKATPLTVRARAVVVSGGALHTPAILLRSGLKHPMIGMTD